MKLVPVKTSTLEELQRSQYGVDQPLRDYCKKIFDVFGADLIEISVTLKENQQETPIKSFEDFVEMESKYQISEVAFGGFHNGLTFFILVDFLNNIINLISEDVKLNEELASLIAEIDEPSGTRIHFTLPQK